MIRTGKELKDYYDDLLLDRIEWDNVWTNLAQLLVPHDSEIRTKSITGSSKTGQLYDSTGIDALDKLTSAIMGTMFSPVVPWFTLQPRNTLLQRDPDVLNWLELVSKAMFDEINSSNFDRVAPGMINSNAAFGTGAMGVMEVHPSQARGLRGFRGLTHMGLPIGTYCIDENAWGDVDVLIRTFWMSARAVLRTWPDAALSAEQKKLMHDKPHVRCQIVHGVIPNDKTSGSIYDSRYMLTEIDSIMIPSLSGTLTVDLEEPSGFPEFPFIVPRWYQSSGDVWGQGRGHISRPELRTANRARQLKLRAWAKAVDPPLMVLNRGVFGGVRLVPGAENVVRSMDAIQPMDFKIRFDHTAIPESESKLQIRQMFYTEQLLQFAVDRKTPPTATEVLQRMDFLHQLLGPATGRLRIEGQTPYLKRVFNMMARAGSFPPPPQALLQAGGTLDIEYLGPLARAQHNDEFRGTSDTLAVLGGLTEFDPNVLDHYNLEEMARDLPRITGISRRYLRSPQEARQRQEARAKEQQAQQAQQQALAQAQANKDEGAAQQSQAQAQQLQGQA